jgi:hypothetical protein
MMHYVYELCEVKLHENKTVKVKKTFLFFFHFLFFFIFILFYSLRALLHATLVEVTLHALHLLLEADS